MHLKAMNLSRGCRWEPAALAVTLKAGAWGAREEWCKMMSDTEEGCTTGRA
jgi:hypothetical protein